MKCTMCDFRRSPANRQKIELMDVSGAVFTGGKITNREELELMSGELSLEYSSMGAYNVCVQIAGAEANESFDIVALAKFPTKTCPNCGKTLK